MINKEATRSIVLALLIPAGIAIQQKLFGKLTSAVAGQEVQLYGLLFFLVYGLCYLLLFSHGYALDTHLKKCQNLMISNQVKKGYLPITFFSIHGILSILLFLSFVMLTVFRIRWVQKIIRVDVYPFVAFYLFVYIINAVRYCKELLDKKRKVK